MEEYDTLDVTPDDSSEAVEKAKAAYAALAPDIGLLNKLLELHIPNLIARIELLEKNVY